jgi:hydrogenase-4 component E|uniref:Formate hydrogenlyase n=1 Tax=Desulfomonile tiedjei TaxID=2358 RepID=A0A7C4ASQ4_9BACT
MPDMWTSNLLLHELSALVAGLFLLTAFGLIATRQVLACLRTFVLQSLFLALSAFVLGYLNASASLLAVGAITVVVKIVLIPWLLLKTLGDELRARREISQVLNIPTSLLIALAIVVFSYFVSVRILAVAPKGASAMNLPIGMAGLLLGAYAMTVRREAVPQIIAILSMENGAFFAGIAIAPHLPLIAELSGAFDVLIITRVMGVLVMKVHERVGTTAVGDLVTLREE